MRGEGKKTVAGYEVVGQNIIATPYLRDEHTNLGRRVCP